MENSGGIGAPAVSVVLATYNGARFVAQQIASIGAQSIRPVEIVLCDDGSRDDTVAVAVAAAEEAGLKLRSLPRADRLGVSANFDRGCRVAVGDVIALCDQDDVWRSDKLARLTAALAEPRVLLAASDAALIDGDGRALHGRLLERLEVRASELRDLEGEGGFSVLLRRNLVTGATCAFRRELMSLASPFARLWVHDEWLAIIASAAGRVVVDPEPLTSYRLHGANQIGAAEPTVRRKVERVLEARGDRTARLRARATELADRLRELGPEVRPGSWEAAREKAEFESARTRLARRRIARIPTVLHLLLTRRYRRFASRGVLDAIRDLLQRA